MSANNIRLDFLQKAAQLKDPNLLKSVLDFLRQPDPSLPEDAPSDSTTPYNLRWKLKSYELRSLPVGEQRMFYRQKVWKEFLEQPIPTPERLQVDELLVELYESNEEYGRQILLHLIQNAPIQWGIWRAFKQIFKKAEETNDFEMLGAIAVRCDLEVAQPNNPKGEVAVETFLYLRRRGWRFLRQLGETLPSLYPHAAVQFLRWYPDWDASGWYGHEKCRKLWIINHIFFHDHGRGKGKKRDKTHYGRNHFNYRSYYNEMPGNLEKHKAFPESWSASPAPVLDLLLLASSNRAIQFGVEVLNKSFKKQLRDLPIPQVIRLGQRPYEKLQLFIKEIIEGHPNWQKADFVELGFHELLLSHFLYSDNQKVREYAITYARDYASDMPVDELLKLLNSNKQDLIKFAQQLLAKRDAREDLGLDMLQKLLLLPNAFKTAQKKLKEGFRPSELSLDWFRPLLFSGNYQALSFAMKYLEKDYPTKKIPFDWYLSIVEDPSIQHTSYEVKEYAMKHIAKQTKQLTPDWIKLALLHEDYRDYVTEWIEKGKVKKDQLDLDWFRAAFTPKSWRELEWVKEKKQSGDTWISDFDFSDDLKYFATQLLESIPCFTPHEVGVDWLFGLLQDNEESNRNFATNYLLSSFNPADFATESGGEAQTSSVEPLENPFEGKSFLFTGKLSGITRSDAQKKVKDIDGIIAKSVTKKLDFLVVGDDGSPLFTGGKKGSKLVKAEKLQADGLPIEIISETDWLRMLSEGGAAKEELDLPAVESGFKRLFSFATEEDTSQNLQKFAQRYLKARHPILGPANTKKPLEGKQVIPRPMFAADLFLPLFEDNRAPIQKLAIEIARYELRRWEVPSSELFNWCQSGYKGIRRFAIEALTEGDPKKKTKTDFHYMPEELDPQLVFALCENRHNEVRLAGLALIQKHYELLKGDQYILHLAESADRDVRTQAVRFLWMRYRQNTIPDNWQPQKQERTPIRPTAQTPEQLTASKLLVNFCKTILFGISPGRLEKQPDNAPRYIPNSKAKLHLIELIRDLGTKDKAFSEKILPLLDQFVHSCNKSEAMACLVAKTQLTHTWQLS